MEQGRVINKVVITAEAEFDYACEFNGELPKKEIKQETEEYINGRPSLLWGYYFRVKFLDESTDRMLMLFVYKHEVFGSMQLWEIRGICPAECWTPDLEESGQVREWLNTKLEPTDERDWVWDLRIKEVLRKKELMEEYGEKEKGDMLAIKELLKNYNLNKTRVAVGNSKEVEVIKADMAFLTKCIEQLDGEAKAIITLLYIQGLSIRKVGDRLGYSKSAIDKKKNRALAILEILFADRTK